MEDLRYPIGPFRPKPTITEQERKEMIRQIAETPALLRKEIAGLDEAQLDTPYRPGGWTVRQVVHHLPDSHLNSYVRFKLALTENEPTIRPYEEHLWAELPEARTGPVNLSLELLEALHKRWVIVLESMTPNDFAKNLVHPENGKMNLDRLLQLYAWHGRHHVAHIAHLKKRMGW
ncbi:MAG TPA: putative metal-dependent hydrolase [Bacteroidota bacterium]|nr:putative metal-dependent hydrolase [Bacteroidota bacterium]